MSSSKYSWLQMPWTRRKLAAGVDDEDLVRAVDPGHLHRPVGDLVDAEEVDPSHAAALGGCAAAPARRRPTSPRAARAGAPARRLERHPRDDRLEEAEDDELARLVGRDAAALEVEELALVDRADRARVGRAAAVGLVDLEATGWPPSASPSRGSSRTRRGSCRSRSRCGRSMIMPFMNERARSSRAPLDSRLPVVSRPTWRVYEVRSNSWSSPPNTISTCSTELRSPSRRLSTRLRTSREPSWASAQWSVAPSPITAWRCWNATGRGAELLEAGDGEAGVAPEGDLERCRRRAPGRRRRRDRAGRPRAPRRSRPTRRRRG